MAIQSTYAIANSRMCTAVSGWPQKTTVAPIAAVMAKRAYVLRSASRSIWYSTAGRKQAAVLCAKCNQATTNGPNPYAMAAMLLGRTPYRRLQYRNVNVSATSIFMAASAVIAQASGSGSAKMRSGENAALCALASNG